MLDSFIKDGTQRINKFISVFDSKIKSQIKPKTFMLTDNIKSGTNYSIRETENVREMEVLVQTGHLKNVIEQDF